MHTRKQIETEKEEQRKRFRPVKIDRFEFSSRNHDGKMVKSR